jgi:transcriptional regulator with GAF, ATPase, and Fis domain
VFAKTFHAECGERMAAIATADFSRTLSRILVASSDAEVRERVLRDPSLIGVEHTEACGGAQALARLKESCYDGVLLDRNLSDLDAAEIASVIRNQYPQTEVTWIDAQQYTPTPKLAVQRQGPQVTRFHPPAFDSPLPGMIGDSAAMRKVYRLVRIVANRDTTVLITGETGTGKELVAEAIHALSPRAKQPFVVVNCAAIPEALLEAELFGHARGAFTGAVQSRLGRIHIAQGGTLFLDEIGELPLAMQAKLLRFLQSGEVQRLGSSDVHRADVRVVCATNAQLARLVEAKQFRMDLYYRLSVFPIGLPPLRERLEDIQPLTEHFLNLLGKELNLAPKRMGDSAFAAARDRRWNGNIRELQHAIERAFILSLDEEIIQPEHFAECGLDTSSGM